MKEKVLALEIAFLFLCFLCWLRFGLGEMSREKILNLCLVDRRVILPWQRLCCCYVHAQLILGFRRSQAQSVSAMPQRGVECVKCVKCGVPYCRAMRVAVV